MMHIGLRSAVMLNLWAALLACSPAPNTTQDGSIFEQGGEGIYGDGVDDWALDDGSHRDGPDSTDATPPPDNAICGAPQHLELAAGEASVNGETTWAGDEFPGVHCQHPLGPWPGPQLYYQVALIAGQAYQVSTTPTGAAFDGALYAFPASTVCSAAAINVACAGHSSDIVGAPTMEVLLLKPEVTEAWIIVVDSYGLAEAGAFVLTVKEVAAPVNTTCDTPEVLTLSAAGTATAKGDTSISASELDEVHCHDALGPWLGPQLYYEVEFEAGKHYKVMMTPTGNAFDGSLYAFQASAECTAVYLNAYCREHASDLSGTGAEVLFLSPTTTESWKLVVDSWSPGAAGPFTLTVEEVMFPDNTLCANARAISLDAGRATIKGDTALSSDEFATLQCGGTIPLAGPQLYYAVDMVPDTTYRLRLKPAFDAFLVLFSTPTCSEAAIEAECSTRGISGDRMWNSAGHAMDLLYTPSSDTTYLAVDSAGGHGGAFILEIERFEPPTFIAPFSFDFEGDCQGLAATNDWQCGELSFAATPVCDSVAVGPSNAHSGTSAWGTRLNDCFTPYGNNAGAGASVCQ
ncbi:MAG: hypothetical protein JRH20_19745, partial [Deltaproteobacteria bacterium]|nr:hypothetical protein [Deltaproteobacteria bacterium]